MQINNYVRYSSLIFFVILLTIFIYLKYLTNDKDLKSTEKNLEESYNSNIIENVKYSSKDDNGNEYLIKALKGEIDLAKPNIIFLTNVIAIIKQKDSEDIVINSDFGKYDSENFDTIFSKNVIIENYNRKISGEYLELSLEKNLMTVSRDVIYEDEEIVMKSDVIEVDIKTKETKIFRYDKNNRVNVKNF